MARGRVYLYSTAIGHGFIVPSGEDDRILVHHEGIVDAATKSLKSGARVT